MTAADLSIGRLAAATSETVKTLRYWSDLGLLPAGRGENGYRRYSPGTVRRVAAIRSAQALGLSLADVSRLLSACDERGRCGEELRLELETHLGRVRHQLEELHALQATLTARLEWVRAHPEIACAVTVPDRAA